jgi:hypothetical protein
MKDFLYVREAFPASTFSTESTACTWSVNNFSRVSALSLHSVRHANILQNVYHLVVWFKGIASRDFGIIFIFHLIDMNLLIGPDQVNISF